MLFLRSLIFNIVFFTLTAVLSIMVVAARLFGLKASWFWAKLWSASVLGMAHLICGIRLNIEGREHLPDEACVVMAKHQSAMETIAMPSLVPLYVWVLKRELFYIPLFGWALWAVNGIAIRRGNPREAIKQVNDQGCRFLKEGRWVVIFPEGTRSAVGEKGEYKPGGITIAQKARVGILPMALNAGTCWPKRGFIKRPGVVTVRFLPFVSAEEVQNTSRKELLSLLETKIESATQELEAGI